MIRLAIAYMRDRPLTVALNALLLAIAVATLVLLLQFAQQAGERFERDARGIDLVVGAKGSPLQLVLSSVYHIEVENPDGVQQGVLRLTVDGQEVPDGLVSLVDDGEEHQVNVTMG